MKFPITTINAPANLFSFLLIFLATWQAACAGQPDAPVLAQAPVPAEATAAITPEAAELIAQAIEEAAAELTPEEAESIAQTIEEQLKFYEGLAMTDMTCTRERITGTRMKKKICKTVEQRIKERVGAKMFVFTGGRRGSVVYVHMMDVAAKD